MCVPDACDVRIELISLGESADATLKEKMALKPLVLRVRLFEPVTLNL